MRNHKHVVPLFFDYRDGPKFSAAVNGIIENVPGGLYAADNLITWSRNLGFFDDPDFMAAAGKHVTQTVEHGTLWRAHTLCWAARQGMRLEGDLVECGTYRGTSAAIIADYVSLADSGKGMWLYDLFEHKGETTHHAMPDHGAGLHDFVRNRFAQLPTVRIIKGYVPHSFEQGIPDKICFLHIDMNNVEAEIGALDHLWERVSSGAVVVFDDYGWLAYRAQKQAEDAWLKRYGVQVLEMPTGQGLVIKP